MGFICFCREQNSTKAEQVFAEVTKAIHEYPVDFRGAQILTGNEEGAFGWITVNYLLETLIKFSFAGKWEHPQNTEVLGALDLGGASTQITFQPGVTIEDKNTSVLFRLYGTNYSLYTHSYLCYGQMQALKRLMAALHQDSPYPQQISHPCYPRGYQENITTAELYDSPCVPAPGTPSPAQVLTVTGTGNPAACRTAILKLFNFTCGANRTCGFDGVYQPPVRGQFFAFAGFYYTFSFLNLTSQQSLSHVNATVWNFCNRNWTELVETFPQNKEHLHACCFVALYILTLLVDGYKFDERTWSSIHFSQKGRRTQVTRTHLHNSSCPFKPLGKGRAKLSVLTGTGRKHRHWLDAGLHAEPHQHDPHRGSGTCQGAAAQCVGRCHLLHCAGHSCRPGGTSPTVFLEIQVAPGIKPRGTQPSKPSRESGARKDGSKRGKKAFSHTSAAHEVFSNHLCKDIKGILSFLQTSTRKRCQKPLRSG
ncbi:ectonucleoside triphosphate diphosphohydrolase 8 isoform X3 [Numida meleagris]|uniref:ectonucleoside triphosphate diphosphohydrolase 8 isoform X3 n=1 Tax=Numida meleagris TaxID=8996 RepID=UPI000B3DFE74|nr:ectonucleoside triphosphate diphosphohydrolase 8 isoform X3 [Numida meleagris]